ncbi:unnamed protein product, partial [Mesorhabditis belari]|uniref:Uncharacterized protein n=1 Tax=Mesorhabditis belari TaxID=2138241 RepID=A0AAF3F4Q6_9BILA
MAFMILVWPLFVTTIFFSAIVIQCSKKGGKRKKGGKKGRDDSALLSDYERKREREKQMKGSNVSYGDQPPAPKPPVPQSDPNYQTLRGLDNNNFFGPDKGFGFIQPQQPPRPPTERNKIIPLADPNYQTLAGLNNEYIFQEKKPTQQTGINIRAPDRPFIVPTQDPNYQTLAGLNNVFEDKKPAPVQQKQNFFTY